MAGNEVHEYISGDAAGRNVCKLNAYKLVMCELPNWSGAWRDLFNERTLLARGDTHQHAYPHYNYTAANEMQENISGDAAGLMFVC